MEGHNPSKPPETVEQESDLDTPQWVQALLGSIGDSHTAFGMCFDIPEITITPESVLDVCRSLRDDQRFSFKLLLCLIGVDYKEYLQVIYVLLSLEHEYKLFVKTNLSNEDPRVSSVVSVWPAADWYERENHDLSGHPSKPSYSINGFRSGCPSKVIPNRS